MNPTCVVGIDPGITGAIAFYFRETPSRVAVQDLPLAGGEISAPLLADLIRSFAPSMALIERVSAMPGQGFLWQSLSCFQRRSRPAVLVMDMAASRILRESLSS